MSWHVTQFAILYNLSGSRWNIVDLEDPDWGTHIVETGTTRHMDLKAFPWCTDSEEIRTKSFRFNRGGDATSGGGTTIFHLYQDYGTRTVWRWDAPDGMARNQLSVVAESVNVYLREGGGIDVVKST